MRLTDIARAVLERVDPPRDIEDYKEKIKTLLDLEQYTKADPELMQAIKQAYQVLAKWKIQHDEEQKLVASEYEEEVPVEETNPIVDAYNQYKQALKQNNVREDDEDRIDYRKHRGMPLKGHEYHYKNGDELRYIIKDAGEAAEAMRGHDETAEAKYLDQINDAATILGYRQKGGKRLEKNFEVEVEAEETDESSPMPGADMGLSKTGEQAVRDLKLSAQQVELLKAVATGQADYSELGDLEQDIFEYWFEAHPEEFNPDLHGGGADPSDTIMDELESWFENLHMESGTGDQPVSSMSREEMIHELDLTELEAMDFADEDLVDMMTRFEEASDGPDNENFESDILSALKEIADEHQAERVKFDNGDTNLVDAFTASAAVKAYESLNPNLQPKAREFMSKSPNHLVKFVGIAMGESKYKKTSTVGDTIDIMREHFDDYEKDLSNRWYQYANYKSTRQKIAELSKRIVSREND